MRTPAFWYAAPGLRSFLLAPLGALYAAGTARRLAAGPRVEAGVPVICVGNLTAGGTGKTPVVMHLAQLLRDAGRTPHIVSRGYGGTLKGPVAVDPKRHKAADVGDEPLLLTGFAPVWVAENRALGAKAAVAAGADILIFDDGFQNPGVRYDLSILVVDAARGFGNGRIIPAGPLREPLGKGFGRADLAILMGQGEVDIPGELPVLRGELRPLPTGMPLQNAPVLAFAGIGHPERFFATLEAAGAQILRRIALGDHQPLTRPLMRRIETEALARNALMVTTEKDAVRLPQDFRQKVVSVPVRLHLENDTALLTAIGALT
ncbi:MAG: tetraacyldisaccharide 4'-kinase [Pseudomonadota bacterium]